MGRHRRQGAAETRRGFVAVTRCRYRQECQQRERQEQMKTVEESIYAQHEARNTPRIVSGAK